MERPVITALADLLRRHVPLSKSRLETMALLTVGMIGARTVNLVHVADERGAGAVDPASTYRRLQRFFQHVRLPGDWAAPMIARLAGGAQKRTLVMDRTTWKIGERHVNILVLAIRTRHSQVPLMWTVLDRAGHSETPDRIALLERYGALFGQDSIDLLLADREFVGAGWFNWLTQNDIPFTIRIAHNRLVTRADGCRVKLATQITHHKRGRHCTATFDGMDRPLHFAALKPKDGVGDRVATNRTGHQPHRPRRARHLPQTLGDREPVRQHQDPRPQLRGHPPDRSGQAAPAHRPRRPRRRLVRPRRQNLPRPRRPAPQDAPPRKTHGYLARSYFRTGFTFLRNRLRSDHPDTLVEWRNLPKTLKMAGVV